MWFLYCVLPYCLVVQSKGEKTHEQSVLYKMTKWRLSRVVTVFYTDERDYNRRTRSDKQRHFESVWRSSQLLQFLCSLCTSALFYEWKIFITFANTNLLYTSKYNCIVLFWQFISFLSLVCLFSSIRYKNENTTNLKLVGITKSYNKLEYRKISS